MITAVRVKQLLDKYGILATIRTYPAKSFEPATNTTILGAATDVSRKIIPPFQYSQGWERTTLISSGKGVTGIDNSGLTFTIDEGLIILVLGKTWYVTGVQPLSTSDGTICFLMDIETR